MKKFLALILTLALALLPCMQIALAESETQLYTSDLGYSLELGDYWVQLTPETISFFEALFEVSEAEALEILGFTDDYISNYANRVREVFYDIGRGSWGGNFIVRRIDKSEYANYGNLDTFCGLMQRDLVPLIESFGGTVLLAPQTTVIGTREFAVSGFYLMETESWQYTTISADGAWYEVTCTEMDADLTESVLSSLRFAGEAQQAVPMPEAAATPMPEPVAVPVPEPVETAATASVLDASYTGSWRNFEEVGLRVYLPDALTEEALSDTDVANGYRYYGTLDNGSAIAVFIEKPGSDNYSQTIFINDMTTRYSASDLSLMTIGEYIVAVISQPDEDYFEATLFDEHSGLLFSVVSFLSGTQDIDAMRAVASSIQPIPEAPVYDLTVADTFDEANPPYAGEWMEFAESGMRIYMPAGIVPLEITEEDLANSLYFYGVGENNLAIAVYQYESNPGSDTVTYYVEKYAQELGEENVQLCHVNGMDMGVLFEYEDPDLNYFVINDETDMFFDVYIYYADTPDMALLSSIASSIQPIPEKAPVYDLTVSDTFDENNPPYAGSWVEFPESGMRVYLPEPITSVDLNTVEGIADTVYYYGYTPDDDNFMIMQYVDAMNDMDDLIEMYTEDCGEERVQLCQVNGLEMLCAYDPDQEYFSFITRNEATGMFFDLSVFADVSANANVAFYTQIASSIQPIPEKAPVYDLTVSDTFDENNPPYAGSWMEFPESGMRIYMPASFTAEDLSNGSFNESVCYYGGSDDLIFSVMQYASDPASDYTENIINYYTGQLGEDYVKLSQVGGQDLIAIYWADDDCFNYFIVNQEKQMYFFLYIQDPTDPDVQFFSDIASSIQPIPAASKLADKSKKFLERAALTNSRNESSDDGLPFVSLEFKAMVNTALGKDPTAPIYAEELTEIDTICLLGNTLAFDSSIYAEADTAVLEAEGVSVYMPLDDLQHFANLSIINVFDVGVQSLNGIEKLPLSSLRFSYCEFADDLVLPEISIDAFRADSCGLTSLDLIQNVRSEYLELQNNVISTLQGLSSQQELYVLNLENNQLVSLSGIECFPNLAKLHICNNQIASLEGVPISLVSLCAENNQISSIEPLAGMINLRSLNLNDNRITSLELLTDMPAIQHLCIARNGLTSIDALKDWPALRSLDVSENNLTSIDALFFLEKLRSIDISHNRIASLEPLANMSRFHHINASYNEITSLEPLRYVNEIRTLLVSHNQLSTSEPLNIVNMQWMHTLDISYNQISSIENLSEIHASVIDELDISGNPISSIEPLKHLESNTFLYAADLALADWSYVEDLFFVYNMPMLERKPENYEDWHKNAWSYQPPFEYRLKYSDPA